MSYLHAQSNVVTFSLGRGKVVYEQERKYIRLKGTLSVSEHVVKGENKCKGFACSHPLSLDVTKLYGYCHIMQLQGCF
jgi:hypothetical protein